MAGLGYRSAGSGGAAVTRLLRLCPPHTPSGKTNPGPSPARPSCLLLAGAQSRSHWGPAHPQGQSPKVQLPGWGHVTCHSAALTSVILMLRRAEQPPQQGSPASSAAAQPPPSAPALLFLLGTAEGNLHQALTAHQADRLAYIIWLILLSHSR